MDTREWREYVRAFGILLAGLAVLFAAAMLSSAARRVFARRTPPDTEAAVESGMPEDPALAIYVWEKDGTESSAPVQLAYRTPVNTGPALEWNERLLTYYPAGEYLGTCKVTVSAFFDGVIHMSWRHVSSDCGAEHLIMYSPDKDFGYDPEKGRGTFDAEISGTNSLTFVWAGVGGTIRNNRLPDGVADTLLHHEEKTLAEELGASAGSGYERVLQSRMEIELKYECRSLQDDAAAAGATLRLTMVSGWQGAGNAYKASNAHLGEDGRPVVTGYDETLLAYAKVKPTWTVELVEYWQAEE